MYDKPINLKFSGQDSLFSIRKLTEDFLFGLQNDFPATLSTVFKTSDKLQVDFTSTKTFRVFLKLFKVV